MKEKITSITQKTKDLVSRIENIDIDTAWTTLNVNTTAMIGGTYGIEHFADNITEKIIGYTALFGGISLYNKFIRPKINDKIKNKKRLERYGDMVEKRPLWKRALPKTGQALVTGLLALALYQGVPNTNIKKINNKEYSSIDLKRMNKGAREVLTDYKHDPKNVNFGTLEGRMFNKAKKGLNLFRYFTGIEGKVPKSATIDYNTQMVKMWNLKMNKLARHVKKGNDGNPAVPQIIREKVQEFLNSNKRTYITLDDYIKVYDNQIKKVNDNIDWQKIKKIKHMNDDRLKLLKKISNSLNGEKLMAYSLTELMPSINGKLNKEVMDHLLRTAGREYIELIPALGDNRGSFGPFQHTSFAVYDKENKENGASKLNCALPENLQIPGSVIYLEGNDHIRAAHLLALNNLSNMINKLNKREFNTLKKHWNDRETDIIEFIAAAHNHPNGSAGANNRARYWLDNNARSSYDISLRGGLRGYAIKTYNNYLALNPNFKPPEPFKKTNQGFEYEVKKRDSPFRIAKKFDRWDEKKNNDKYKNLVPKKEYESAMRIKRRGSKTLRSYTPIINPGDKIYISTHRK